MLKQQAIDAAKKEAAKAQIPIFLVEAPIEVRSANEFEEGPWAYGPACGIDILYKFGVVAAMICPNGAIIEKKPPYPIDRERWEQIREREQWECNPQ